MQRVEWRRAVPLVAALVVFAVVPPSRAQPPTPEPNFAYPVLPSRCTAEPGNKYEASLYDREGFHGADHERYAGACQRLHFTFGPVAVKPGQNDVILQPVTIEKPAYDGYVVRLRPNLVRADGSIPPIEEVHLHHGVWYSVGDGHGAPNEQLGPVDFRSYGNGPFFASGEEKTIFDIPRGYGFPVKATDNWELLYMVHNQRAQPDTVWITYDVDYVAKDVAERQLHLRPSYPVWLDVRPSTYPVFNVQRKYGHRDPKTNRYVCTWPRDRTADADPWGNTFTGQGAAGNGEGTAYTFPARGQPAGRMGLFQGGTLIGLGGHLHPGGLSVDVDLERASKRTRIFTSEARYWDWKHPDREGGPPTSWDLSMTATGLPRWGVHVEPGDKVWINATYDAEIQSSYEDMGIAVGWIAPDDARGPTAPNVNPFVVPHDTTTACSTGGVDGGHRRHRPTLCEQGVVTHGHMTEADHKGGPSGMLPPRYGAATSRVDIAGYTYLPGDASTASSGGIPTVPLGTKLQFVNDDAPSDVYHSITSCAYPCTGPTGIAFPLADGKSSRGDRLDFDSAELGYGIPTLGPAKNRADWTLDVSEANGFKPGTVYSYFCRVHPFMRGAFAVPGPGLPTGPPPTGPPPPTSKPGPAPPHAGGDWRTYGHDFANTRVQDQEHTIGPLQAAQLSPAWTFSSKAAGGEGDFTGTPVVADGLVIAGSNRGWVFAMNADDGALVWKTKVPKGGVNSTVNVTGGTVYVAVSSVSNRAGGASGDAVGPYVMALDERTGATRWQSGSLDTQAGADVYGSPVAFDGVVTIGVSGGSAELADSSERDVFHGSVVFLDATNGRQLKKTWTIPPELWPQGYAGAAVWSTPAVDTEGKVAYVGTGNPYQPEHKHKNADAILKLDLDRRRPTFGSIIGVYDGTAETYASDASKAPCVDVPGNPPPYYPQGAGSCGDLDMDFGAAPNLMTEHGRTLIGDGQKSGVYHVVDAKTMAGVWTATVGPPSSVGGIVGSTAYDGHAVYGPITVPGYVWSVDTAGHNARWASPVADGVHWGEPVAVANGVVYTVDLKGFLDAYDAGTGVPVLHRPLLLGSSTGTDPASSWGGVSVARNTVYAATGITSQANGFIVALRPGATQAGGPGGGGGGTPGPSVTPGPAVVAGPGAYASTYATPAMVVRVGGPLSFVNNDLPQHDVTASDTGPDGKPLFRSKLIGIGEVTAVDGTDRLVAGKSYGFYCSIHPGMKGTLLATS